MRQDNRRKLGAEKEERAALYLEQKGYQIKEKNFYSKKGEIDLIAEEGGYLVFIEVKYRADETYGYPEEAITPFKRYRISQTALSYLQKKKISLHTPVRFDVVSILGEEIRLIPNAFFIS